MAPSHDTETIAALATPAGTGALAVIRVSGPLSRSLAEAAQGRSPQARRACYHPYRGIQGALIDELVSVFYAAPASYTGEDSWELSCHGNPLIVRRLLEDLCARGCRLAEAGEFSKRAFLNGRLDLSQVEAVVDLINARSERALGVAHEQLGGSLRRYVSALMTQLTDTLAHVEAYIDFPDEDLPPEDRKRVAAGVGDVLRGTQRLAATSRYGDLLRNGIRTVIAGAPNAGKSSLLNRLVGYHRALVSPEPGTTRDFIEERLNVGAHLLQLVDTAGLNSAPGELEARGIELTREQLAQADLILWVVDARAHHSPSPSLGPEAGLPVRVGEHAGESTASVIWVWNKVDLLAPAELAQLEASNRASPWGSRAVAEVAVSAATGRGIESLAETISHWADAQQPGESANERIAVNARHHQALIRADASLRSANLGVEAQRSPELVASDIREALSALGEIAGRFDNEAMLDRLFSTFCIGK